MKTIKILNIYYIKWILLALIISISLNSSSQNCITFTNDSNLQNWSGDYVQSISFQNEASFGDYLYFIDGSGFSAVGNNVDFQGNWLKKYPKNCLCFDYRVDWNENSGTNAGSVPKIVLYTGAPLTNFSTYSNRTRAVFIGNPNNPQIQDNKWSNFCLPIKKAENNGLPSNQFGTWKIFPGNSSSALTGSAAISAWNNLITNITGLILPADYNNSPSEKISFDNFCAECTPSSGNGDPILNNGLAQVINDIDLIDIVPADAENNDNCCPPWNKDVIIENTTVTQKPNAGLNANYTIKFNPTQQLKNQMQAYLDYISAMNPNVNSIIINWQLRESDKECKTFGAKVAPDKFTIWNTSGNGNITGGNFWTGYPLEVGKYYKLHTGIYLNGNQVFFDKDECASNHICIFVNVLKSGETVLEVNVNGRTFRKNINSENKIQKNINKRKAKIRTKRF